MLASLRQRRIKPGTEFIREWDGTIHRVVVVGGRATPMLGQTYRSLSEIARLITGTNWNGPRFFGLRQQKRPGGQAALRTPETAAAWSSAWPPRSGDRVEHQAGGALVKPPARALRCAIYTRKSTEHGLEQEFNSLDAQREAAEAYIKSQAHEGWRLCPERYDDGGLSGGTLERPALQALLADVAHGRIDVIVVYKVDRLTRSLADFAKLVELFDKHGVSFVSVTQQFNTTNSMGRLTLNVLLSFAQFEREVTGERIRDKIAASKKKGIWMGGPAPLGYRVEGKKLRGAPDRGRAGPHHLPPLPRA